MEMSSPKGPTEVSVVETVVENESMFSNRQAQDAKAAHVLQMTVGIPTDKDFKTMVTTGLLKNCPVTSNDIEVADQIYGPSVVSLKGKTARDKPKRLRYDLLPVPRSLNEEQKKVMICGDVMHVNKIPFLITIGVNIGFTTIEALT